MKLNLILYSLASSAAIKIDNHDSLHYNEILSKKNFYRRQSEGDLSASLLEFNNVNESEDDNSSTGKQQDDVLITLLGDTKLSTKSVDINSVHSMKQSSDTNIKATLPMHSSTKSSLLETTKVSNIGGDERQALSSVTFNLPSASASASASSSASSSASTSVPSSASSSAPSSASSASEISPSDIPNQLPGLSITKTSQIQRKHIAPKTVPAETNIFSVNDSFTQNDNDAASIKTTFSRISTPQPSTSAISNAATKIEPSPTPNLLGSGVIIQTTSVESNPAALLQNAPLNNMVADTPFITFNADKETSSLASEFPTPTDSILRTPDFDISANTFSPNVMPMDTENKPDIPKDTEQQQTSKGQSSLLESTGSKVLLGSVTGSVVVVGAIIGSILISKKKRRKNNILKYNDSSRRGSPDSFNEKYFQDQPKPNLSENASLHISQLTFATNNSREVFRSNVNSNNNYFNNSKFTIDSFQKPTLVTLDRKLTLIPENTVESGHFAIDFTTMPRDKSSAIEIDEKYKSIYSSRTKKSNSYSFSVAGSDLQSFSSGSERIESVYSVETFSSYDDGKRESTYSEYNMPINYDSVNYNAFHF
ncbi:hypothetical protein HDU92_002839 [Lobulomyces angularis]|nr:hypothetical protein HDU92_002839 [Lobulomyces angularis]